MVNGVLTVRKFTIPVLYHFQQKVRKKISREGAGVQVGTKLSYYYYYYYYKCHGLECCHHIVSGHFTKI